MENIKENIKLDTWVYVIVQNPGENEQFLGQYDQEHDLSFIPFFTNKEDAQQCFLNLPRDTTQKYEIQAIIYEDLIFHAKKNSYLLYQLDGSGKIISTR